MDLLDLVIIGGGPAGLTASTYASCFHLKHIVIAATIGGQLLLAPDILNYPGFDHVNGKELTDRMLGQVKARGGEVVVGSVIKISKNKEQGADNKEADIFEVETIDGKKYKTKSIILATGTERRKLNIPGEVEYTARGVHYCATCEKLDYEGKICAVVGGANSAVQAAAELAQAAAKVYIIYRGTQLRGDPIWLDNINKNPKIEVIYSTIPVEILGDGQKMTGIRVKSSSIPNSSDTPPLSRLDSRGPINSALPEKSPTGRGRSSELISSDDSTINYQPPTTNQILSLDKIFIEIGGVPGTALVIPLGVKMDPGGYISVNDRLATNVPGVFAAGDLVSSELSIEQIASSVGLGARAAASAFAYIKQDKAPTLWGGSQIKRQV